jgi:hypothetical protein
MFSLLKTEFRMQKMKFTAPVILLLVMTLSCGEANASDIRSIIKAACAKFFAAARNILNPSPKTQLFSLTKYEIETLVKKAQPLFELYTLRLTVHICDSAHWLGLNAPALTDLEKNMIRLAHLTDTQILQLGGISDISQASAFRFFVLRHAFDDFQVARLNKNNQLRPMPQDTPEINPSLIKLNIPPLPQLKVMLKNALEIDRHFFETELPYVLNILKVNLFDLNQNQILALAIVRLENTELFETKIVSTRPESIAFRNQLVTTYFDETLAKRFREQRLAYLYATEQTQYPDASSAQNGLLFASFRSTINQRQPGSNTNNANPFEDWSEYAKSFSALDAVVVLNSEEMNQKLAETLVFLGNKKLTRNQENALRMALLTNDELVRFKFIRFFNEARNFKYKLLTAVDFAPQDVSHWLNEYIIPY